jgi:hypothetical protein
MDKVMKIKGTFFEDSVPGPSLTFVNFFGVFSRSFVLWNKKPKSLKNNFFRAYADAKLASNYLTSIVGINKIIPAFAYARKKLFFKLFCFLYHGTKLVEKTQKKFIKVRILELVPVRNPRKRYPPFS